jgi:oligopeptide transport system substrate-binding protein
MVPPGMPGYTSPESALSYDPERAAALLAEAGYPQGVGLPELGIVFNTHEAHKKIAEVIADQLRKNLGVRAVAYNQEWQSYLSTVRSGDYDIARAGWVGDYLDPNTFLDQWVTNGGNNQTGFSSAPYDTLLRAAADMGRTLEQPQLVAQIVHDVPGFESQLAELGRTTEPERRQALIQALRMRLLSEAERILVAEEFPVMPLYFYVQSGFISPRVDGFYSRLQLPDGTAAPNLQDLHPLRGLSVRQP